MNSTTLPMPADERRNRILGWGVSLTIVAAAGIPYLAMGDPAPYMVLIPVVAGGVGLVLYSVSRPLYVAFLLWVWMFTPLVRRLLDYSMGAYVENNLVMTAPFAVGGIGILGLMTMLTEEARGLRQAFMLVLVALTYGAAMGIVVSGPVAMTTDLFDWGLPVVLSALVLVDWRQYPGYRTAILRTLVVAMGIMGLYGLYQFFVLPPWDRLWMQSVDMTTIGRPYPGQVRVFGPLNSPLPFALTLAVGLLGLFAMRGQGLLWGTVAWASAVPAIVSLLLTETRTAWGAIVVGFFFILLRSQARSRRAIVFYLITAAVASVPILLSESVSTEVTDRAATLGALDEDHSAEARAEHFQNALPYILATPTGVGLGAFGRGARVSGGSFSGDQDSGFLIIAFTLGWGGALLYAFGLGLLFLWVWRSVRGEPGRDRFPVIAAGVAVAVLSATPFGNTFSSVAGMYMWGFLGLALAGVRYYRAQDAAALPPTAPSASRAPLAAPAPAHP